MEQVATKKPDKNGWYVFEYKDLISPDQWEQILEALKLDKYWGVSINNFLTRYELIQHIDEDTDFVRWPFALTQEKEWIQIQIGDSAIFAIKRLKEPTESTTK